MTFVTVGTAFQPFRRLLSAVDALAGTGVLAGEHVVMQTGHDQSFAAQHVEAKAFLKMDEFDRCLDQADVIICHGGCTVFQALRAGKTPVVMPRQKKFGEHINDHQVQFVQALAGEGRVIAVYDAAMLAGAIEEARRRSRTPVPREHSAMPDLVARAIEELSA